MIGGMIRCDICKNPIAPEFAELCSCKRDVCLLCSNYQDSEAGEFNCCDICYKQQKQPTVLTGEIIWEAFRPMFPPYSTGSWTQAPHDTQEKYNKVADKLNRRLI